MRGKAGPKPATKAELEEQNDDPTAEEIVGAENVVDVGSATEEFAEPPLPDHYKCDDCKFTAQLLSEIQEHCEGTGHGGFDLERESAPDSVQPELFSEPGVVHRMVNVSLPIEVLNEKRTRLAALYQSALDVKEEKKSADDDFNARLKNIDSQMQEIARVLKTPFTYEKVDCEWRVLDGQNARGLYRLDTGEQIEVQPLSEEDRVKELEKANEANAAPETEEAPA